MIFFSSIARWRQNNSLVILSSLILISYLLKNNKKNEYYFIGRHTYIQSVATLSSIFSLYNRIFALAFSKHTEVTLSTWHLLLLNSWGWIRMKARSFFFCATLIFRQLTGIVAYPRRRFRPPDPTGKHWKSMEHRNSIPARNCPDFFLSIPANFRCFPAGTGRKSS